LLEKGVKINKKGYIDKIIRMASRRDTFDRWSSRKDYPINSKKQIDYMLKLGCTSTDSKICNLLASKGAFKIIPYMYEKFGYIPMAESVLSYFSKYRRSFYNMNPIVILEFFEYLKNTMNLNIFTSQSFASFNVTSLCELVSSDPEKVLPIFKYFVKEGKIVLTSDHLEHMIHYLYDPSFEEIFGFFKEHNIVPNKEFLMNSVRGGSSNIVKYLINKFKFTFTLKELHNLITSKTAHADMVIIIADELNIKITPYTIKLVFDTYFSGWYQTRYFKILISNGKEIMQDTYDIIINSHGIKLIKFVKKNNIKVVNYNPELNDEVPDILPVVHNDDFDDDSSSDVGEKDYVDEILAEYKV
ncbi:MAG: hypothetical protein MUO21_03070, partial [Nitrososphaeraceae archaeon]|nr:hypothetical protein [Nitrososphaeraceae archaeon]